MAIVCANLFVLAEQITDFIKDTIFETYTIQSAADDNTINLEVPLQPLHRALKSAQNAISASIRLTKKDNVPLLSLTITTSITSSTPAASAPHSSYRNADSTEDDDFRAGGAFPDDDPFRDESVDISLSRPDRETLITQDIPIRVLAPAVVHGLMEPRCREPDVHIVLPSLIQLKGISDRFTKLALSTSKAGATASGFRGSTANVPKLELSANMHGCLRLRLRTDAMNISSVWTGLTNPVLDPGQVAGGEEGIAAHPSTRMRTLGDAEGRGEEGWASVRVEGKDWGKVLGVGRLGGRVIACKCGILLFASCAGSS